jgi:hypothetical protein
LRRFCRRARRPPDTVPAPASAALDDVDLDEGEDFARFISRCAARVLMVSITADVPPPRVMVMSPETFATSLPPLAPMLTVREIFHALHLRCGAPARQSASALRPRLDSTDAVSAPARVVAVAPAGRRRRGKSAICAS